MSHKFYTNKDCPYYPCHDTDELNCLFCFCPLYDEKCGGIFEIIEEKRTGLKKPVKDCSKCIWPHKRENYERIIFKLRKKWEK